MPLWKWQKVQKMLWTQYIKNEKRDMMLEEYKSKVEGIRQQLCELRDSL